MQTSLERMVDGGRLLRQSIVGSRRVFDHKALVKYPRGLMLPVIYCPFEPPPAYAHLHCSL